MDVARIASSSSMNDHQKSVATFDVFFTRTTMVLVVSLSTDPKLISLYSKPRFGKLISPTTPIWSRCGWSGYTTVILLSIICDWRSPLYPGSNDTTRSVDSPGDKMCSQASSEKGTCVRRLNTRSSAVRFVSVSGRSCTIGGVSSAQVYSKSSPCGEATSSSGSAKSACTVVLKTGLVFLSLPTRASHTSFSLMTPGLVE